eukprot:gene14657-19692_t
MIFFSIYAHTILSFGLYLPLISAAIKSRCGLNNACSGQGMCMIDSGQCDCFPGFQGYDCSLRLCPAATGWVGTPSHNNSIASVHNQFAECSNMGICDRKTGICNCRKGFGGSACDTMLCPITSITPQSTGTGDKTLQCSNNGKCMSLREVGRYQDFNTFIGYSEYAGWDADKIFGCVCDEGWEGISCQKKSCPKGDDPSTDGVDEVQLIDCKCSTCRGGLRLSFRAHQTLFIPCNASASLIEYRIKQAFLTVSDLTIENVRGKTLCSAEGSTTMITFKYPTGPQHVMSLSVVGKLRGYPITIRSKGDYSLFDTSIYSVIGTKEHVECSNNGLCDYKLGQCTCFSGYRSSDGQGNIGSIPDCGYRYERVTNHSYTSTTTNDSTVIKYTVTNCPFVNDLICAGNGICEESTGLCLCYDGFGGAGCSNATCGSARTWFGKLTSNHEEYSVCGGVGECDGNTGKCTNCGGGFGLFYGDSCEYMSCYKGSDGKVCSGNGACLTLREMAELSYNDNKELAGIQYDTPWDANAIRGCSCLRSISIDNQYSLDYNDVFNDAYFNSSSLNFTNAFSDKDITRFYRGPYAFAATDFTGNEC